MLLLLTVLALIAVLAARVDAGPIDDRDEADNDGDVFEPALPPLPLPMVDLDGPLPHAAGVPGAAPIPISEVVAAAYRAAALDHDPGPGWRRRTRLAGLVPAISIRDGRDAMWKDVASPTLGYISVFAVTATWRFDRLIFDPSELRIATIEVSRRRQRRRVAMLAIRTYAEWLQLHATDRSGRAELVAAELDALTDGWFSETITKMPGLR